MRKERPHPGVQLRFTDIDGHRFTAFATNSHRGQLATLELRHRRRARCEDRIRGAKDTGLTNLPLHDFAQNEVWCAVVALAGALIAWSRLLAFTGLDARRWEVKRLRHRLFSLAGRLARHARTAVVHLAAHHPWAPLAAEAISRLRAPPAPDSPDTDVPAPPTPKDPPRTWTRRPPHATAGQPATTQTGRRAQLKIEEAGNPARDQPRPIHERSRLGVE